ncbi:MAG: nitroreductase family protein [Sphingomonadaceae bacterium]|nr:nitroreductase family protein [Sphingomonadaceae bacterium]
MEFQGDEVMTLGLSVDQVLTTTRTVRRRLDVTRPVPRKLLEECLEIALQAPNGSNFNRWHWIIVDDPEMVAKVGGQYQAQVRFDPKNPGPDPDGPEVQAMRKRVPGGEKILDSSFALAEKFDKVPAILIPLMRGRSENYNLFEQSSAWGSIYPAIWSFCLAARERGLGTAWTTASCMREREMCEVLGIPHEKFTHIGMLPIGYYEGTSFKQAWRRPVSEVLTYNSFGG